MVVRPPSPGCCPCFLRLLQLGVFWSRHLVVSLLDPWGPGRVIPIHTSFILGGLGNLPPLMAYLTPHFQSIYITKSPFCHTPSLDWKCPRITVFSFGTPPSGDKYYLPVLGAFPVSQLSASTCKTPQEQW